MEIKVQMPFQQLLQLVRSLTSTQKKRLRQELDEEKMPDINEDDFINYLLNGPVYSKEEISIIEENRKSLAAWRKLRN